MAYWDYPRYVTVAEKRAKAARKLEKIKKKNPDIQPIIIEGRTLAHTWWGKAWNRNLEGYADYHNRIGRGRSYVRHGAVLDLQIDPGEVRSLVQGSRSKPYTVTIGINALGKKDWNRIKAACIGKLESLQGLLKGEFPKALGEIFMEQGKGLFPTPGQIVFDCSCPDFASMCKHVAATLYGIGARLDEDPSLFFNLRQVNQQSLISHAVEEGSRQLLKRAKTKSRRIIADADVSDLFGIDMEEEATPRRKSRTAGHGAGPSKILGDKKGNTVGGSGRKSRSKKTAEQVGMPVKKEKGKGIRRTEKRTAKPKGDKAKSKTDTVQILDMIKRSRKGVDIPTLKKRSGIDVRRIRNIVYRAHDHGLIRRIRRGVYLGAVSQKKTKKYDADRKE